MRMALGAGWPPPRWPPLLQALLARQVTAHCPGRPRWGQFPAAAAAAVAPVAVAAGRPLALALAVAAGQSPAAAAAGPALVAAELGPERGLR